MRCLICNKNLSDTESTRKHAITKEYLDTCNACLREIVSIQPIPFTGNWGVISDYSDDDDEETKEIYDESAR